MMPVNADVTGPRNRRVLIVDDNRAIHDDIRKSLAPAPINAPETEEMEALLFGDKVREAPRPPAIHFEISSAYQGEEGIAQVHRAVSAGAPFALAFMDVRIPPGLDGIEALARIWQEDPALQAVICSAYSDYSWAELIERLPQVDRFLVLKKPFDSVEIRQMAYALTEKWNAHADSVAAYESLKRASAQEALGREREAVIRAQAEVLSQLSMPFIPITEHVAVMPLIGDMDGKRVERISETLVQRLADQRASAVIIDLTGVENVAAAAVVQLVRMVQAVALLGTELILTGIRGSVARRLVELGADFRGTAMRQTLQEGIDLAMRRRGS